MDAHFIKSLGSLRPADASAEELLDGIPNGTTVKAKITRSRSGPHHRLFFGILGKIYKHSDAKERWGSFEDFREIVTIGAGHYRWIELPNGKRESRAKSIAWSKLGQDEFNVFFEAALECIYNKLQLVDEAELRREVEEMLKETVT